MAPSYPTSRWPAQLLQRPLSPISGYRVGVAANLSGFIFPLDAVERRAFSFFKSKVDSDVRRDLRAVPLNTANRHERQLYFGEIVRPELVGWRFYPPPWDATPYKS